MNTLRKKKIIERPVKNSQLPILEDAQFQFLQGCRYFAGKGEVQSYEAAIAWFTEAAKKNYPKAQYCLGCMYLDGIGVARDAAKGTEWLRKSADNGYVEAKWKHGEVESI